jgi:hypothetical protein
MSLCKNCKKKDKCNFPYKEYYLAYCKNYERSKRG